MDNRRKIIAFILLTLIRSTIFCQERNANDKLFENRLITFYKQYIEEVSKTKMNLNNVDSLRKDICTKKLYKNIKELDYDPFIGAQDVSDTLLKSLTIKQDSAKRNMFYVSYYDDYFRKRKKIILETIIVDKTIKISSISTQH